MRAPSAVVLALLACAGASAPAVTFHRSFRNGYPAALGVSKAEATESFRVTRGGMQYTDGRGGVLEVDATTYLAGRVVEVPAGDALVIEDARRARWIVHLRGVEAPGAGQPGAAEARARLRALAGASAVRVENPVRVRAGHVSGTVWPDCPEWGEEGARTDSINVRMVREGYARARRPGGDPRLTAAQNKAKAERLGIWRARGRVHAGPSGACGTGERFDKLKK